MPNAPDVRSFTGTQYPLTELFSLPFNAVAMRERSDQLTATVPPLAAVFILVPVLGWAALIVVGMLMIGAVATSAALAVQMMAIASLLIASSRRHHAR